MSVLDPHSVDGKPNQPRSNSDEAVERYCEIMHDAYEAAAEREGWQTELVSGVSWVVLDDVNKTVWRGAVRAVLPVVEADIRAKIHDEQDQELEAHLRQEAATAMDSPTTEPASPSPQTKPSLTRSCDCGGYRNQHPYGADGCHMPDGNPSPCKHCGHYHLALCLTDNPHLDCDCPGAPVWNLKEGPQS